MPDATPLTPPQRAVVDAWFPGWALEEDLSWGLQGIAVLRLRTAGGPVVVKASETKHHLIREARAHRQMTGPLLALQPPRAARLLQADTRAGVIAASWLPGNLVAGSPHERSPEVFRQAGELLARVHVPREQTTGYDAAVLNKVGDFLARAAGLALPGHLRAAERLAAAHRSAPRWLSATHGDYTPRNWVVDGDPAAGGLVRVIDWGRSGYRPWVTDLVRLEHQWFQPSQDAGSGPTGDGGEQDGTGHDGGGLRAAFYAGYGRDPAEESDSWRLDNILQALGTIVWSREVGDAAFEEEGRRMLARVVDWFA
ncbi:phosphotransferase family protein [Sinomonas atrocyanea]